MITTGSGSTKDTGGQRTPTPPWSRFRDPRIVRVSRAFGGKDRHSKVCTIRGLRDRRVRLSVPTAIQLYDLQDRLGFNQPSKVVDWLLKAAKHGIDSLPPLQIPPDFFTHHFPQTINQSAKPAGLKIRDRSPGGFVSRNPYSLPGWFNPYVSPNLALICPPQTLQPDQNLPDFSLLSSGSHQPGIITQPYFHPPVSNPIISEYNSKEMNHFQLSSSGPAFPMYHFTTQPAAVKTMAFGTSLSDLQPLLQKHAQNEQS